MQVSAHNLSFAFGNRAVLDNVSFTIPANEVTALLGVSGCGKSTIIKLFAGLLQPTGGAIHYGQNNGKHPGFEDISVVFQDTTLLPWKTVRRNIEIARVENARLTTEEIAREVGMTDALDLYPDQLSGGMKQRVEFGRVLAQAPKLLLMDEPFSRLDVQYRERLQSIFLHIHELTRPTSMVVTHDIREAARVSSHIKVLVGNPVSRVMEYETSGQPRSALLDDVERILQDDFNLRRIL